MPSEDALITEYSLDAWSVYTFHLFFWYQVAKSSVLKLQLKCLLFILHGLLPSLWADHCKGRREKYQHVRHLQGTGDG